MIKSCKNPKKKCVRLFSAAPRSAPLSSSIALGTPALYINDHNKCLNLTNSVNEWLDLSVTAFVYVNDSIKYYISIVGETT